MNKNSKDLKEEILKEFNEKFVEEASGLATWIDTESEKARGYGCLNGLEKWLKESLINLEASLNQEWKEKVDALYTNFEKDKPPMTLSNNENLYNKGLYKGQLKAMENLCRELFGIDGDQLKSLLNPEA